MQPSRTQNSRNAVLLTLTIVDLMSFVGVTSTRSDSLIGSGWASVKELIRRIPWEFVASISHPDTRCYGSNFLGTENAYPNPRAAVCGHLKLKTKIHQGSKKSCPPQPQEFSCVLFCWLSQRGLPRLQSPITDGRQTKVPVVVAQAAIRTIRISVTDRW